MTKKRMTSRGEEREEGKEGGLRREGVKSPWEVTVMLFPGPRA